MSELQIKKLRNHALHSARTAAAWLSRDGWAWIEMKGADRADLLHRLTTNDLTKLVPSSGIQTVLLTDKARIIDVLTVLHGNDSTHLLGSPGLALRIIQWLRKYVIIDDVRIRDLSSDTHILEICGPSSGLIVTAMLGVDVSTFTLCQWMSCELGGQTVVVSRLPSISEVSYWIIGPESAIDQVKDTLRANSEAIPELSMDEAEYLRVLSGQGAIGHEWTEAYNPLEAGLLHLTSFTKGCYIGQEVVARLDSYNKVKQRVMGVVSDAPLSVGAVVVADDVPIGVVTSVATSCDGATTYALAYVRGVHANPDTPIFIRQGDLTIVAGQVLPPMQDVSCL